MTHPAVRLLALAMLALAVLLALHHPTAPATPPAKAPQLATTTTTARPPGYVPTPAGPPPTTRPPS